MTSPYHKPVIQRNSLYVLEVLQTDLYGPNIGQQSSAKPTVRRKLLWAKLQQQPFKESFDYSPIITGIMELLTAILNAIFGYMEHNMRVASEVILNISIEQECIGPVQPHPWDHYPFITSGRYVWLRYHDLDCGQRDQIRNAVERVKYMLSQHSSRVKANMPYWIGDGPKQNYEAELVNTKK